MVTRKTTRKTGSPKKTGRAKQAENGVRLPDDAVARLQQLLQEMGHLRKLQQSAATMPDVRARLEFIDQSMHEASEKTLSAIENSLPLTVASSESCARLAQQLADTPTLSRHKQVQETISALGEIAATEQMLHHNLMLIMEAQEFRDVAGQMAGKIVAAASKIEAILLAVLAGYAPIPDDSLISKTGQTSGPALQPTPDGVIGQDEVDDLLSSLGL